MTGGDVRGSGSETPMVGARTGALPDGEHIAELVVIGARAVENDQPGDQEWRAWVDDEEPVCLVVGTSWRELVPIIRPLFEAGVTVVVLSDERLLRVWRHRVSAPPPPSSFGGFEHDAGGHRITWSGEQLRLTESEYRTLGLLLRAPGCAVTFAEVHAAVWDGRLELPADRAAIRALIRRLRRKLLTRRVAARIEAVRGFGFRLVSEAT